jgi:hypothetical protein
LEILLLAVLIDIILVSIMIFYFRQDRLPFKVRFWLWKIGKGTVRNFIISADRLDVSLPDHIKRQWVRSKIKELILHNYNYNISDHYINLMIEYIYEQYKLKPR